MNIAPKDAYFVLAIPFTIIWILLYIFNKDTKREQLLMSFILLPLGTITEVLYFQDYWRPLSILHITIGPFQLLLEDFIFTFSIGGIGAVIYEVIFHKRIINKKKKFHKKFGLPIILILATLFTLALFYLGINSIFATAMGFILIAILILLQRKDLLADSLLSGFSVMSIMFFGYIILYNFISNSEELVKQGWLLYGTHMDIRIFHIPLTEMIWGFSWGVFTGPLYAFMKDKMLT